MERNNRRNIKTTLTYGDIRQDKRDRKKVSLRGKRSRHLWAQRMQPTTSKPPPFLTTLTPPDLLKIVQTLNHPLVPSRTSGLVKIRQLSNLRPETAILPKLLPFMISQTPFLNYLHKNLDCSHSLRNQVESATIILNLACHGLSKSLLRYVPSLVNWIEGLNKSAHHSELKHFGNRCIRSLSNMSAESEEITSTIIQNGVLGVLKPLLGPKSFYLSQCIFLIDNLSHISVTDNNNNNNNNNNRKRPHILEKFYTMGIVQDVMKFIYYYVESVENPVLSSSRSGFLKHHFEALESSLYFLVHVSRIEPFNDFIGSLIQKQQQPQQHNIKMKDALSMTVQLLLLCYRSIMNNNNYSWIKLVSPICRFLANMVSGPNYVTDLLFQHPRAKEFMVALLSILQMGNKNNFSTVEKIDFSKSSPFSTNNNNNINNRNRLFEEEEENEGEIHNDGLYVPPPPPSTNFPQLQLLPQQQQQPPPKKEVNWELFTSSSIVVRDICLVLSNLCGGNPQNTRLLVENLRVLPFFFSLFLDGTYEVRVEMMYALFNICSEEGSTNDNSSSTRVVPYVELVLLREDVMKNGFISLLKMNNLGVREKRELLNFFGCVFDLYANKRDRRIHLHFGKCGGVDVLEGLLDPQENHQDIRNHSLILLKRHFPYNNSVTNM